MANLVIDIGNTLTKVAVFDGEKLISVKSYDHVNTGIFDQIAGENRLQKAIISTVKKNAEPWEQSLAVHVPVVKFNYTMAKSIKNYYQTPHTLGADRIAAVAGAFAVYPSANSLVIDAGTCITYDFVDANAGYFGGSISPGLKMRFKALHQFTQALPLVEPDERFESTTGTDTVTAIRSGVQNGIMFEVMGFINQIGKNLKQLNIVLSGGDWNFFDTLLKNSIFAAQIKIEPYLVLKGLNAVILQHND